MGGSKLSDEDDLLLKSFADSWKASFLTDEQKTEIINLSNLMLEKKARGNPHFITLTQCLLAVTNNENINKSYSGWMDGMFHLLKTTKTLTAFTNYMNFTLNLSENGFIFKSGSVQWKFSNQDIVFQRDKSGLWVKFNKGDLTCYSRRDSIVVLDTEGIVNPVENIWIGNSGIVTWEELDTMSIR
ncbi:MAG: hypothetical protein HC905_29955 [Bacteroidales bacterium]|nr:hypothetical protein [Bacteroidales bacterium]